MKKYDIAIMGSGIAGAGLAYFLAGQARVALIEAEAVAGYHTTGRSAAFFAESYGGLFVQPLTRASKAFLSAPPAGFLPDLPSAQAAQSFLTPRGAVYRIRAGQEKTAEACAQSFMTVDGFRLLDKRETEKKAPHLKADDLVGGLYDPSCADIDVARLHQAYLRGARQKGVDFYLNAGFQSLQNKDRTHKTGPWSIKIFDEIIKADILVNSAGAWADQLASQAGVRPLAIKPLRRTIIVGQTAPDRSGKTGNMPERLSIEKPRRSGKTDTIPKKYDAQKTHNALPLLLDVAERFYFKPEGAGFLISPADETPSPPMDAQPELEDIARAAAYFEEETGYAIIKIKAKWAGLRNFAPDRLPVIGFDPFRRDFFWSAGQGGFGIQTSPAWSLLAASQIIGGDFARQAPLFYGIDLSALEADLYHPRRFF